MRHHAEYVLQETDPTLDLATRRSRQAEDTRAVEMAREIERLVAIQRRLGVVAAGTLSRDREWELS